MEVQLIIKNLNVYNSYFKKFIQGDVVINDGKFLHIGSNYEEISHHLLQHHLL